LFSATTQLKHRQSIVEEAEIELHRVEAKCIKKLGKKDKQTKSEASSVVREDDLLSESPKLSDHQKGTTDHNNSNNQSDENDIILGDIFEDETYTENAEEDFSSK